MLISNPDCDVALGLETELTSKYDSAQACLTEREQIQAQISSVLSWNSASERKKKCKTERKLIL